MSFLDSTQAHLSQISLPYVFLNILRNQNVFYLDVMKQLENQNQISLSQLFNNDISASANATITANTLTDSPYQQYVNRQIVQQLLSMFVLQNYQVGTSIAVNNVIGPFAQQLQQHPFFVLAQQQQQFSLASSALDSLQELPITETNNDSNQQIVIDNNENVQFTEQLQHHLEHATHISEQLRNQNNAINEIDNNQSMDLLSNLNLQNGEGRNTARVQEISYQEQQILIQQISEQPLRTGLSKYQLQKIPLFVYQGNKKGFKEIRENQKIIKNSKKIKKQHQLKQKLKLVDPSTDLTCCICLCEYNKGNKVRELICGHKYHKKCIDKWLQQENTCPYCKKLIK